MYSIVSWRTVFMADAREAFYDAGGHKAQGCNSLRPYIPCSYRARITEISQIAILIVIVFVSNVKVSHVSSKQYLIRGPASDAPSERCRRYCYGRGNGRVVNCI